MMRAGWRHILHPAPTVQTAVDLAPQAARSGRLWRAADGHARSVRTIRRRCSKRRRSSSPRPRCRSKPGRSFASTAGPAFRPTSPPAPTACWWSIRCRARPWPIASARRRAGGNSRMYRVAPQSGPMCVTFAMSGIGEAWLDDVAIQSSNPPSPPRNADGMRTALEVVGETSRLAETFADKILRAILAPNSRKPTARGIATGPRLLEDLVCGPYMMHLHSSHRSEPMTISSRQTHRLRQSARRRTFCPLRSAGGRGSGCAVDRVAAASPATAAWRFRCRPI